VGQIRHADRAGGLAVDATAAHGMKDLQTIADRLIAAQDTATTLPPITTGAPDFSVADGYAVLRDIEQRRRAQGWREACLRVRIGEMHADGHALVEHEIAIDQHGNQAVRVELQVFGRLVRRIGAIDEVELERDAELFEQDVNRETGVAGIVVELDHGFAGEERRGSGDGLVLSRAKSSTRARLELPGRQLVRGHGIGPGAPI